MLSVWPRALVCLLVLLLCVGCGRENEAPANIPIVLNDGRFSDPDATAVVVTTAPSTPNTGGDAAPATDVTTAPADVPTPLATVALPTEIATTPTRTLTETLEELVGTPGVDATAEATETTLGGTTVGALRVAVLGVRVAALDASLTDPGDNRALVVRARFENGGDSAVYFQAGSDTTLRDAAGTEYAANFIARTSARANEPDTLIAPGGSVEGEIAYVVPNTATAFEWSVRNGDAQASLALPNVPASAAPDGEPSASAAPPAETTTAEPE